MNSFLFRGLAMAMLSNGMAFAADAYQPAEYQPKVDYSAPAAPTKPEAVVIVSQPENVDVKDVKDEAKPLQPEASPVKASPETAKKTAEDSPRAVGSAAISSPSEQTSGSSSNIVLIVAGLAAIGIFFFRRQTTTVSSDVSGRSVESVEGTTGVERYVQKLEGAKKTGVEKYLESLPEAPPLTGVAKYLARQRK